MHTVIAAALREQHPTAEVATATLQEPEHGLTAERLASTDVLFWWGHVAHDQVADEVVDRVVEAVHAGMGLVVLHSGHYSKPFTRLMGTTCSLKWRNDGERELVWTIAPEHPIAAGVPHPIVIDRQEMYGEYFDIPRPDEEVFLSTSPAARSSGPASPTAVASAGSSTSRPATRSTPSTTTRTSSGARQRRGLGDPDLGAPDAQRGPPPAGLVPRRCSGYNGGVTDQLDGADRRTAVIEALDVLGAGPEERFDRITRMTHEAFGVPLTFLNLVHHDVVTTQSTFGWQQGRASRRANSSARRRCSHPSRW